MLSFCSAFGGMLTLQRQRSFTFALVRLNAMLSQNTCLGHRQSFYLWRLNAARCAIRAFSFEPGHSDLAFIVHSSCRLSSSMLLRSYPTPPRLRFACLAAALPSFKVWRRVKASCPSSPPLTHASFMATCEDLARVVHASPCLRRLAFRGLLCHLLTLPVRRGAFISSFKPLFLKLRTLLGRKRVAFFLCWGSQISLQCSAGGS